MSTCEWHILDNAICKQKRCGASGDFAKVTGFPKPVIVTLKAHVDLFYLRCNLETLHLRAYLDLKVPRASQRLFTMLHDASRCFTKLHNVKEKLPQDREYHEES